MTLTELRYIVTLAQERHFRRAAERCFVSQPTLSVAIKKLEDELDVTIFERNRSDVRVTMAGERIVAQARKVLEEAELVLVRREGRQRWNYLNALPIKHIHDRWIGDYAKGAVSMIDRLKTGLETETVT